MTFDRKTFAKGQAVEVRRYVADRTWEPATYLREVPRNERQRTAHIAITADGLQLTFTPQRIRAAPAKETP
jgi:hypothetical protein